MADAEEMSDLTPPMDDPWLQDYMCPDCGTVTSHFATKLACRCYQQLQKTVNFHGVWHIRTPPPSEVG